MMNIGNYRSLKLKNSYIILLVMVVLSGTCIRLINLTQPLLEGSSTRQFTTAMVARNFYHHGFKLFYPQIEGGGDDPGYVMQEFYIIPFVAAIFYWFMGGVHEWVLRLLSVISYILAAIMLYKLSQYYFSRKTAIISVFCFTVSPISIYLGRAVHPEMLIAFFNMATIYAFSRWIFQEKNIYGLWAILSFVFAVLLKVPNLYLLLPILFIVFVKYHESFLKQPKLWFFLMVSSIPIGLFNLHQHLVRMAFPNPSMDNFKLEVIINYLKVFLRNKYFYKAVYENMISYTLTPIGFVLFILGLMLKPENKRSWLFHIWILSIAIFFLLMPAQSRQGYYQMHLLPAACIIIAGLIFKFYNSQFFKENFLRKRIFTNLFLSVIFLVVLRYTYAFYEVPKNFRHVVETGQVIDRLTEKDALVIASVEGSGDLLYYANRRGWGFMIHGEEKRKQEIAQGEDTRGKTYDPIVLLELFRSKGADYFASASMEEFFGHEKFSRYMFENYRVIQQTTHYIIFDLRKKNK